MNLVTCIGIYLCWVVCVCVYNHMWFLRWCLKEVTLPQHVLLTFFHQRRGPLSPLDLHRRHLHPLWLKAIFPAPPRSWIPPWQPPCCNFYPSLKQSLLATCHMSTRPWDQWSTPPDPIQTGLMETLMGLKQVSVPLTLMIAVLVQPWQNLWSRPWWRTGPFQALWATLGSPAVTRAQGQCSSQGTRTFVLPGYP